jgi:hypothetical protein
MCRAIDAAYAVDEVVGFVTATSRGLKGAGADQVSRRCNGA